MDTYHKEIAIQNNINPKDVKAIKELDEHCSCCGRSFLMFYWDKEMKTGKSETKWGSNMIFGDAECYSCKTKNNKGKPPLKLGDINEMRERGISEEEFYKEKGY